MKISALLFWILIAFFFTNCNQTEPPKEGRSEANDEIEVDSVSVDSAEFEDYLDTTDYYSYYPEKPALDSAAIGINFSAKGTYTSIKQRVKAKQQRFKSDYLLLTDSIRKQQFRDSVAQYITDVLLNDIFPHWYGTEWDFNGITETPGDGYIACGYFVSTTLKHIGVNMNRYKFAQQSGMNGAKTLQMGKELQIYNSRDDMEMSKLLVSKLKPGLYQVGLSCHVGYLLIRNQKAYFIHSDFISFGVKIEDAEFSDGFESEIYVISDITYNDKLIEKWLLGKEIVVIRE